MTNVILIGFTASGKSSLGRALALNCNLQCIDLDAVIEDIYETTTGTRYNCRAILENFGRQAFFDVERKALCHLDGKENMIISTGGGIILDPSNRAHLSLMGTVIYLYVSPEVLFSRMQKRGFPAYLSKQPDLEEINRHCTERDPLYRSIAQTVLDNSGNDISEVVKQLKSICLGVS